MSFEGGASVSFCSLRVDEQIFGVETEQVQEVLRECVAQRVPLAPCFVAGVIPYRGEVLLTVSLRALLKLPPRGRAQSVLVLRDDDAGELFGLAVDFVDAVLTVRGEDFIECSGVLDECRKILFAGAYRMRDSVMVRLDPQRLRPSRLMEISRLESVGGCRAELDDEGFEGSKRCAH